MTTEERAKKFIEDAKKKEYEPEQIPTKKIQPVTEEVVAEPTTPPATPVETAAVDAPPEVNDPGNPAPNEVPAVPPKSTPEELAEMERLHNAELGKAEIKDERSKDVKKSIEEGLEGQNKPDGSGGLSSYKPSIWDKLTSPEAKEFYKKAGKTSLDMLAGGAKLAQAGMAGYSKGKDFNFDTDTQLGKERAYDKQLKGIAAQQKYEESRDKIKMAHETALNSATNDAQKEIADKQYKTSMQQLAISSGTKNAPLLKSLGVTPELAEEVAAGNANKDNAAILEQTKNADAEQVKADAAAAEQKAKNLTKFQDVLDALKVDRQAAVKAKKTTDAIDKLIAEQEAAIAKLKG